MSVVAIVVTDGSGVIHGSGVGGKRRDASPVGRAVIGLGRGGVRLTVVKASMERKRGRLSYYIVSSCQPGWLNYTFFGLDLFHVRHEDLFHRRFSAKNVLAQDQGKITFGSW